MLNVSAYRFVPLDDLPALRAQLQQQAEAYRLKGTVLLAPEGINLFLAGDAAAVHGWLAWLRSATPVRDLPARESWSAAVPFRHLRVKIKREIIRMDRPAVRPGDARAPAVDAPTLARWLAQGHDDDGIPLVLLDTRNGFEVDEGRFLGALDWRLQRFSQFPAAAQAHAGELAGKTVVTYCTGGIRCEKAALELRAAGVPRVLQLDGGILGYLQAVPGAPHWRGRCFVFDGRGTLDVRLQASGLVQAGSAAPD